MNFIKMKYENLAFLSRGKYSSIEELNQVITNADIFSRYLEDMCGFDSNKKGKSTETYKAEILWVL